MIAVSGEAGRPCSSRRTDILASGYAPHQEVVVAFGTTARLPAPIPSTYRFPPDL
jgi:hypothetical protein